MRITSILLIATIALGLGFVVNTRGAQPPAPQMKKSKRPEFYLIREQSLVSIDRPLKVLMIFDRHRFTYAYRVDEKTRVTVDGKPAKLEHLKERMTVSGQCREEIPRSFVLNGKLIQKEDLRQYFSSSLNGLVTYRDKNGQILTVFEVLGYMVEINAISPKSRITR